MPGESKKISELESASSLNNGDLIELASVNVLSETGYSSKKTTVEDLADKVATLNPQVQADWNEADSSDPSYIQNKPTLATVATSGSYNDLLDQPTIPAAQVNSDWNSSSGVSEILNKPTLGTAASKNTGVANGVAELDANGLVPTSQLPAYVDDVLEYASQSAFPATGETGKIYVALDTNLTYRWGGTEYVEISPSLALGETSSTAYAGNKGKANADAISAIQTTLSGLATVATSGNYNDLTNKPAINDATITFTQGGTTKGTITLNQAADATIALDAGGGGGGGHTILDDEGTSLTQRTELQFKGAYSVDNNTDQITEVNVVREMTKAEFDLLTDDEKVGIINVTDDISGGLKYVKETLYSNIDESAMTILGNGDTITLTDNIFDYDEIYFEGGFFEINNSADKKITHLAVTKVMKETIALANSKYGSGQYEGMFDVAHNCIGAGTLFTSMYCLKVPTDTTLSVAFKYVQGWSANLCTLTRIIGIKYLSDSEHTYSTDEHIVGKWIDGKTLYEKTIAVTQGSSETYISLSGLDIDTFFVESAYIKSNSNGGVTSTTYYVSGSDRFMYYYDSNNDRLVIQNSWQGSGYVTIRYTKSTT